MKFLLRSLLLLSVQTFFQINSRAQDEDEEYVLIKAPKSYFDEQTLPFARLTDEDLRSLGADLTKSQFAQFIQQMLAGLQEIYEIDDFNYFLWNSEDNPHFGSFFSCSHLPKRYEYIANQETQEFLKLFRSKADTDLEQCFIFVMNSYDNKEQRTEFAGKVAHDAWRSLLYTAAQCDLAENLLRNITSSIRSCVASFISKRFVEDHNNKLYISSVGELFRRFGNNDGVFKMEYFHNMIRHSLLIDKLLRKFLENEENVQKIFEVMDIKCPEDREKLGTIIENYRKSKPEFENNVLKDSDMKILMDNKDLVMQTLDKMINSARKNVTCFSCRIHAIIQLTGLRTIFKSLVEPEARFSAVELIGAVKSMQIVYEAMAYQIDMVNDGLRIYVE